MFISTFEDIVFRWILSFYLSMLIFNHRNICWFYTTLNISHMLILYHPKYFAYAHCIPPKYMLTIYHPKYLAYVHYIPPEIYRVCPFYTTRKITRISIVYHWNICSFNTTRNKLRNLILYHSALPWDSGRGIIYLLIYFLI